MSNLAAALKAEVTRLARKTIREEVEPLKALNRVQKRQIATLKQAVADLERKLKTRQRETAAAQTDAPAAKHRFVAKGLRSLRSKLELSADDFGRLIGASGQSVYQWEAGKTAPRAAQVEKIASVRGLGKREARARLEALAR